MIVVIVQPMFCEQIQFVFADVNVAAIVVPLTLIIIAEMVVIGLLYWKLRK